MSGLGWCVRKTTLGAVYEFVECVHRRGIVDGREMHSGVFLRKVCADLHDFTHRMRGATCFSAI